MDLRPFSLKPDDSAAHALERIDRNGVGVGLVLNRGKLAGAITDADIRSAVLSGKVTLEDPLRKILRKSFPAVPSDARESEKARVLKASRVPALIVTESDKVVGIVRRDEVALEEPKPEAVIMAGGRGQRLRPLTDKVPKPLLKMGSTTIVERIIGNLAEAGIEKVWMAVNYKARSFEKTLKDGSQLGVRIEYLKEEEKLDTAGPLSLLPEVPAGGLLVTNADILTRLDYKNLIDFHRTSGESATIAVIEHSQRIPYGVVRTKGPVMTSIEEKPEVKALCNAGIYMLGPKVVKLIGQNEALGMPDLLYRVTSKGWKVSVFPIFERWFDIGSPEDFQRVLLEFATGEEA